MQAKPAPGLDVLIKLHVEKREEDSNPSRYHPFQDLGLPPGLECTSKDEPLRGNGATDSAGRARGLLR